MTTRRSGLGRGLESLIPQGEPVAGAFAMVAVNTIDPNPMQPRALFDASALEALTASIREIGMLQPIVVQPEAEGRHILVAGERRLRASKELGLKEIPAVIRTVDSEKALVEALVENVQRENLTPLEEAAAFQQLMEDFGLTHQEVGDRVGKSRSAITNTLRLMALPAAIQGLMERNELTPGHARALLGLDDKKYAIHIAERAAAEGWSVRQVEDAARDRVSPQEAGNEPAGAVTEIRPVAISELEVRLSEKLDTKVEIAYRNNKGVVKIKYHSLEDLERIYRFLY
jgi:ParB family chromosome partitioning protein